MRRNLGTLKDGLIMRALSLLLVFFLIVPLAVEQAKAAQGKDDGRIHDEVLGKLANDTDVRGGGFEVVVKNGMVTLRGQVHTAKAKEKAEKLTKKIKGVVGVDNQLKLIGEE
jgi:osmotically-inducible protein OsmY